MALWTVACSLLIGCILGCRFKVLILGPGVGALVVAIVLVGIAHGDRVASIVTRAIVVPSILELGYFLGGVLLPLIGMDLADMFRRSRPQLLRR